MIGTGEWGAQHMSHAYSRRVVLGVAVAMTCLGSLIGAGTAAAAVSPPQVSAAFSPAGIQPSGTSTLTITITNPAANSAALTGLAFNDTLPTNVTVASTPNLTNTCGGTATATAASSVISLSGGTVGVNSSCTVSADVTSAATGSYQDSTGQVSSNEAQTASATATLNVANPPTLSEAFIPSTIAASEPAALSFTITNPNTGQTSPNSPVNLTGIAFTDTFPSGLQVPTAGNSISNTCGGTVTAPGGATSLSFTGGTLTAGSTCTISVEVEAATVADYSNTTGPISANESGTGATSNTATLDVTPQPLPPTLTASFGSDQVNPGGTTSLTFDVANPNASTEYDNVTFEDILPSGLVVSTPNALTGSCVTSDGATIRAAAGAGTIRLLTVDLPGNTSCSFTVNVTVAQPGVVQNTTAEIAGSFNTGAGVYAIVDGETATSTTTVTNPVTVAQNFSASSFPQAQATTLTFTLTNPDGAVNGIGLTDTLSSGLAITNPNGASTTCAGATVTASPGSNSVAISGANLGVNGSCTFSVSVTGTAQGAQTSNSTAPTAGGQTNTNTATASTTVGPPLNTFTATHPVPEANGTVTVDATVPGPGAVWVYVTAPAREFGVLPSFRIRTDDGPGDPGPGRFEFGQATENVTASGTVDLTVPPSAQGAELVAHHRSQITTDVYVTFTPTDGTPNTLDFLGIPFPGPTSTVPSNKFTISNATATPTGKVTFDLKLPDPGKLSVIETASGATVGKSSATAKKAGKLVVTIPAGSKLAKLIAKDAKAAKKAKKGKKPAKIALRLSVTFTPTLGYPRTKSAGVTVPPATS